MFIKLFSILLFVLFCLFILNYFVKSNNLIQLKELCFKSMSYNYYKKGNQIMLYNPSLAKVPGVNPIILKSLRDYEKFIKWQRESGINCPILHLEHMYDTQGFEQYEIKNSFMLDQPNGPLNHNLPNIKKTPSLELLLNADHDNIPYNQNSFPAYDEHNQNVGRITPLDNKVIH